ncbi:MAG: DUF4384 domain-containing protein [Candidatus Schekmanbacteria bacterium]|nr:DUF4384 domain-containing protein [Candidatus Schekmanbacteria bacterium]
MIQKVFRPFAIGLPAALLLGLPLVLGGGRLAPAAAEGITPRAPAAESPAEVTDKARDLYFATDSSGVAAHPGLRVRLYQRNDACDFRQVSTQTTFHSGDAVRFGVEPNGKGYLYIVQRGSSGQTTLLYPHKSIDGGRNRVQRGRELVIPGKQWFNFDENAGSEEILFILGEKEMDVIPYLIPAASSGDAPPAAPPAGSVEEEVLSILGTSAPPAANRDLVLSPAAAAAATDTGAIYDSTYSVNVGKKKGFTVFRLRLRHN